MGVAPVALFAYRRLNHTVATIEALKRNDFASDTPLYLFSDAARSDADRDDVAAVRAYLRGITGFASVTLEERARNMGLANSIIAGVSAIVERHGRVVVLEDDMVTSRHFLRFMNEGLDAYADEPRVASVHGYIYPFDTSVPETFFLRGTDCWGWATWARAWQVFERDPHVLLEALERAGLNRAFDLDGSYSYTGMLADFAAGRNDSWAVRWHASAFAKNMLTLFPGRSLVANIGLDRSGTHCQETADYDVVLSDTPIAVRPIAIEENTVARDATIRFHRATQSAPVPAVPPARSMWFSRLRGLLSRRSG